MILIIDLNREPLASSQFTDPIRNIAKSFGEVKVIDFKDSSNIRKFNPSHIIMTGTPIMDNEYLDHLDKFMWLVNYDKPVLGICAGMQVLACVHGCLLVPNLEIGMKKISVLKQNDLMTHDFEAYCLHGNSIEEIGPFEVLARSESSIQAIRHGYKYGVLFHPEVRNPEIIESFLAINPEN